MRKHLIDLLGAALPGDVIRLTNRKDNYQGGDNNDHILARDGQDHVRGGSGDDVIEGQAGNDTLDGQRGNDMLYGGIGGDWIAGGSGEDYISGGAGRDNLGGESGSDVVYGGAGEDRIVLSIFVNGELAPSDGAPDTVVYKSVRDSTQEHPDTLVQFSSREDRIDLSGIDADATSSDSNEAFHFIGTDAFSGNAGELRFQYAQDSDATTLIFGDVDGDGRADLCIFVRLGDGPRLVETDVVF